MTSFSVRPTRAPDVPALQAIAAATDLFPPDMLPDLLAASGGGVASIWLSGLVSDRVAGLCFAEPEPLTDGTWNMRALAVAPDLQGQGLGRQIVADLEQRLRQLGHRLLSVDTSGTEQFALKRAFYRKAGYEQAASVRDFWAPGDAKITFCKSLQ